MRARTGGVPVRQNVAWERATKAAWNAKSEGSDNPIAAYRPIFLSGRQTTQFANKKKINMSRFVASTGSHRTNNCLKWVRQRQNRPLGRPVAPGSALLRAHMVRVGVTL